MSKDPAEARREAPQPEHVPIPEYHRRAAEQFTKHFVEVPMSDAEKNFPDPDPFAREGRETPPPLDLLAELVAILEPLLDNADGYDSSRVRACFRIAGMDTYLPLEERARLAWKALRSALAGRSRKPCTLDHAQLTAECRAKGIQTICPDCDERL